MIPASKIYSGTCDREDGIRVALFLTNGMKHIRDLMCKVGIQLCIADEMWTSSTPPAFTCDKEWSALLCMHATCACVFAWSLVCTYMWREMERERDSEREGETAFNPRESRRTRTNLAKLFLDLFLAKLFFLYLHTASIMIGMSSSKNQKQTIQYLAQLHAHAP